MRWICRGGASQALISGTEVPNTEQTETFLGTHYMLKSSAITQHRDQHRLIYRGVRYSR